MTYFQRLIAGGAILVISSFAHGAIITTNLEDATNGGGFFGEVIFEDIAINQVRVTADISDPINSGLTKGDILGLWFDLANFGALSGPVSLSGDVLGSEVGENAVSNTLGGPVNINGSGAAGWDLGLVVGQNGGAGGFNQTVSLVISWMGLDALQFDGQRAGMRVQSIAGGSFAGGSSKLRNVPEPSILALFGFGLLGLGIVRRKRPERSV